MLARVGERLLDDAQRVTSDRVRYRRQVGDANVGVQARAGGARFVEQCGQRRQRRLGWRWRLTVGPVAKQADHGAEVLERLVGAGADHRGGPCDLLGRRLRAELERAGVQAQQRDPVGEGVVHLARDAGALGVPDLLDAQLLFSLAAASAFALRLAASAEEHPPQDDRRGAQHTDEVVRGQRVALRVHYPLERQ
jgi:hypothetical protein